MPEATVYRYTESLENADEFLESASSFIQEHVSEDEKVVCALSGGVDSSVTAMIFEKAIGDRLYPIHFDTGFMRKIEGEEEVKLVEEEFGHMDNFELIDKSDLFHENVFGIENSEEKRIAFRNTYEQVLNEKIREIGADAITQGTIRPDIMETKGEIKSQNNVDTNFDVNKMIEPLTGLYKPQVRLLAREIGLPEEVYLRQPFPGPGLSVRTVEEINDYKLENEKTANDYLERFVENYFEEKYGQMNLWDQVSGSRIPFQYFSATFDNEMKKYEEINNYMEDVGIEAEAFSLKNKATGVVEKDGEKQRVYAPVILLRGDLEQELIYYLGKQIPKRFEASRVLFELASSSNEKDWIVGLRIVDSEDAITAEPLKMPFDDLRRVGEKIVKETDTSIVGFDVSPKPPATIEYE